MGYNLAIEFLADFEKTWELEAFQQLDRRVLQPQQRALKEWLFLEVHMCCASCIAETNLNMSGQLASVA